jgi:hypothetical protein
VRILFLLLLGRRIGPSLYVHDLHARFCSLDFWESIVGWRGRSKKKSDERSTKCEVVYRRNDNVEIAVRAKFQDAFSFGKTAMSSEYSFHSMATCTECSAEKARLTTSIHCSINYPNTHSNYKTVKCICSYICVAPRYSIQSRSTHSK